MNHLTEQGAISLSARSVAAASMREYAERNIRPQGRETMAAALARSMNEILRQRGQALVNEKDTRAWLLAAQVPSTAEREDALCMALGLIFVKHGSDIARRTSDGGQTIILPSQTKPYMRDWAEHRTSLQAMIQRSRAEIMKSRDPEFNGDGKLPHPLDPLPISGTQYRFLPIEELQEIAFGKDNRNGAKYPSGTQNVFQYLFCYRLAQGGMRSKVCQRIGLKREGLLRAYEGGVALPTREFLPNLENIFSAPHHHDRFIELLIRYRLKNIIEFEQRGDAKEASSMFEEIPIIYWRRSIDKLLDPISEKKPEWEDCVRPIENQGHYLRAMRNLLGLKPKQLTTIAADVTWQTILRVEQDMPGANSETRNRLINFYREAQQAIEANQPVMLGDTPVEVSPEAKMGRFFNPDFFDPEKEEQLPRSTHFASQAGIKKGPQKARS